MQAAPRGLAPIPPEKGSFPLDHFRECTAVMQDYLKCMREHGNEGKYCRALSKAYLECRMEHGLMAKEDLRELGFRRKEPPPAPYRGREEKPRIEEAGFVAGLTTNASFVSDKLREEKAKKQSTKDGSGK